MVYERQHPWKSNQLYIRDSMVTFDLTTKSTVKDPIVVALALLYGFEGISFPYLKVSALKIEFWRD